MKYSFDFGVASSVDYSVAFHFLCLLISLFYFSCCKANVDIDILDENTACYECCVDMGELATKTLTSFSKIENPSVEDLFDSKQIEDTLVAMGLSSVVFSCKKNDAQNDITLHLSFQAPIQNKRNMTKIQNKSFVIMLSPQILQDIAESSPKDFSSYIDLLMPPVLQDEECTKQEYEQTLQIIYGQDLARQLTNAKIEMKAMWNKDKKNNVKKDNEQNTFFDVLDILLLTEQKQWQIPIQ